jgi:hypothetical protein
MITYADYLHEAERRKDEMAQAESHRLSLQVPKQDALLLKRFRSLLARLGAWLVTWGDQLQTGNATRSSVS